MPFRACLLHVASVSLLSTFVIAFVPSEVRCAHLKAAPSPTYANIAYASANSEESRSHQLDLYLPKPMGKPVPVVIWTGGSAWRRADGKAKAGEIAAHLNRAGLAVAGVSIRSSAQTIFPGQLYDIAAAIRWLRANAARYNLDPNHIGIMGESSGGWAAVMAAVTGDKPEFAGNIGTAGISSAVQAAVAFYPPTDFPTMGFNHYSPTSPESLLLGCAVPTCPKKAEAANPVRYVTSNEPPIMLIHGEQDKKVPYNQSELLYKALKKACDEAVFISLPKAGHGPANAFLTSDALRKGTTIRSTSAEGCKATNPTPFVPNWRTVIAFFDRHLRD